MSRKKNRTIVYSERLGHIIAERLAEGESLQSICSERNVMPWRSTVIRWTLDPEHPFYELYHDARKVQSEILADEMMDIADDGTNDYMIRENEDGKETKILDREHITRSQLRVGTRKWYLSCVVPRFQDKKQIAHSGEVTTRNIFNVEGVEPDGD